MCVAGCVRDEASLALFIEEDGVIERDQGATSAQAAATAAADTEGEGRNGDEGASRFFRSTARSFMGSA